MITIKITVLQMRIFIRKWRARAIAFFESNNCIRAGKLRFQVEAFAVERNYF